MTQMNSITNNLDFFVEYNRIRDDQKFNFEDFALQFSLSIISFFKMNFSFIQEFDYIQGNFISDSDFSVSYMNEIYIGLVYITQIQKINHDEIFKATCDFFLWFSFKICFLIDKDADPEIGIQMNVNQTIQNYIFQTQQSYFYNKFYSPVLDILRTTLVERMIRPVEVKINLDEFD